MRFERGTYAILTTPFDPAENVDYEGVTRVVHHYVKERVRAVVALAVMGEGNKILPVERVSILQAVVRSAGDTPVIVGVTGPGTRLVCARVEEAALHGAQAVLVAPPQSMNDDMYVAFFSEVGRVGLPIVLQDHPESTGIQMSAATLSRIVQSVRGVTAIKLEAPPTGHKIATIRALLGETACTILGGLGALSLMDELAAKSDGTMTGFAYPHILTAIVEAYFSNQMTRAEALYQCALPWLVHESTSRLSLAIRKEFLRLQGIIPTNILRSPSVPLDALTIERTKQLHAQMSSVADRFC